MKQDRRSTKLSDDDVETLDIPDGVELEEIKADDDESRTDDSSTHLAARLLGMPQRLSAIIIEPVSENEGLLLIPLAAVQEDADGIYVCTGYDKGSGEATAPAAITTGLSDGENVEVLSGLSEGDTVYYRYTDTLEYSFVKQTMPRRETGGAITICQLFLSVSEPACRRRHSVRRRSHRCMWRE